MPRPIEVAEPGTSSSAAATSTYREVTADAASCPLAMVINMIGGRWKMHILRALVLGGPMRFNVLLGAIADISAKELTRNLRELEAARLVVQDRLDSHPVYALTEIGRQIETPFRALGIFGTLLSKP